MGQRLSGQLKKRSTYLSKDKVGDNNNIEIKSKWQVVHIILNFSITDFKSLSTKGRNYSCLDTVKEAELASEHTDN